MHEFGFCLLCIPLKELSDVNFIAVFGNHMTLYRNTTVANRAVHRSADYFFFDLSQLCM